MTEMHIRNYAYLGDAVWELWVREHSIKMTQNAKDLHKITTDRVKAGFQAKLLHEVETILTEEEQEIARRGRNLSVPIARRSNQLEYRQATAFETLVGYWYINNKNRLQEILATFERKCF